MKYKSLQTIKSSLNNRTLTFFWETLFSDDLGHIFSLQYLWTELNRECIDIIE